MEAALKYALQLLEKRSYSKKRLAFKLGLKGYHAERAAVLVELAAQGFINDQRYAQRFIEQRQLSKPSGKKRLILDLMKRGIERELAEQSWRQWEEDELRANEDSPALLALRKRQQRGDLDLANWQDQQKLFRFLSQRGFSYTEAKAALAKLLADDRTKRSTC